MKEKIFIKGKLKNNILKIKFSLRHLMISEKEAISKNIELDYINYIKVTSNTRILYELELSGNIAENPLFRFEVKQKDIQIGDKLEVEWTTLLAKKERWSIEIQKSFSSKKTKCKDELLDPKWDW